MKRNTCLHYQDETPTQLSEMLIIAASIENPKSRANTMMSL